MAKSICAFEIFIFERKTLFSSDVSDSRLLKHPNSKTNEEFIFLFYNFSSFVMEPILIYRK